MEKQSAMKNRADMKNHLTNLSLYKKTIIFADDIFNSILLNENDGILIRISLKNILISAVDAKPTVVQVIAWHQSGNKPLPEPMMSNFMETYVWH